MLQLKNEIVDDSGNSCDNKTTLVLDLQSAFAKVKHAAILSKVSKLNMREKGSSYIKDCLMDRTAERRTGDIQMHDKKLASIGTPQESVISLLLFNFVIISVADRLPKLGFRHNLYADNMKIWTTRGSDSLIEANLEEAVNVFKDHLDGCSLIWWRSKPELLIIPPQ
ncbi:uncharacterized protein LOC144160593 [Haemaphysalis longicornis]